MTIYKVHVEFTREFLEIQGNQINIGVKSRPYKGEANKEIVKKIARYLKVPASAIQIRSGQKSQDKIIEVTQ